MAALAMALVTPAAAAEEKSLLAADGTLYEVRAGLAADLGISEGEIAPDAVPIEWTERHQDGSMQVGIIPGPVSRDAEQNLVLAVDVRSGTLLLLWKEELT